MHARRSLHTLFVATFGLLLVWGGLLGAAGVARGQTSYEILHAFTGADGDEPTAGVIQDSAGTLYGTTQFGGVFDQGTVYKLEANSKFTVLHSFTGADEGGQPFAGVTRDSVGTLYGTTFTGGAFGTGTVYKLDTDGRFTVLHSFNGSDPFRSDGGSPFAGVIIDSAGTLYGTTWSGGAQRFGIVYKLEANGTYTILHSFMGDDGINPFAGVVRDSAGTLYGTTRSGPGNVYKLEANGTFTVLHTFTEPDGFSPHAGVIVDSAGNLFGTTGSGGANGFGTIYKVDANGTFTVLHAFTAADGIQTRAGVVMDSAGTLYGTTYRGGAFGYGTVYKFDVSGTFTVLQQLDTSTGRNPWAGVIRDSAGNLYGTTSTGGPNGNGVVFRIKPTPTTETIWFEAEPEPAASSPSFGYSNVTTPMLVREDPGASDGRYIVLQQGVNNIAAMPAAGTPGIATYKIFTKATDNYRLYARVIAPTGNDDSFWVCVDGGTPIKWNNITPGSAWHWDFVHDDVNLNTPINFALTFGYHVIEIGGREDGTMLDVLALSNDPTFNPTTQSAPHSDPAWLRAEATAGSVLLSWTNVVKASSYKVWASNSTAQPYAWTLLATTNNHTYQVGGAYKHYGVSAERSGRTTTAPGRVIDFTPVPYYSNLSDAEYFGLTLPMNLTADLQAIEVPSGPASLTTPPATGWGRLDFRLPKAAIAVKIWGRVGVGDATGTHDSFWVRVDGSAGRWIKWNNLLPVGSCTFIPIYDSDAGGAVVTFNLAAGTHVLEFAYRETAVQLNRVFISDSPSASLPPSACTD